MSPSRIKLAVFSLLFLGLPFFFAPSWSVRTAFSAPEASDTAPIPAEPATATERLQQDAQEAQRKSDDLVTQESLWDDAFYQYQAEFENIVTQVDSLYNNVNTILQPLQKSLSGVEQAARRLFALASSQRLNPMMLEAIDQRGVLLETTLHSLLQPPQELRQIATDLEASVDQIAANFSRDARDASSRKQGERQLANVKKRLAAIIDSVDAGIAPGTALLESLTQMHSEIGGYLPGLWKKYYFSAPIRFFDPGAWRGIQDAWEKTLQNWALRLTVDMPHTAAGWQEMGLRFLNVFIFGLIVIFFAGKALRKRMEPKKADHILVSGLGWVSVGLAIIAGANGPNGEVYRGILRLGSLFVIWGEMALAWDMRCLVLSRPLSHTPLWPLFLSVATGTIASYPDLPAPILSVVWTCLTLALIALTSYRNRRMPPDTPPLTRRLRYAFYTSVWITLGIVILGWGRLSILFIIVASCVIISIQLTVGLMQIVNLASADAEDTQTAHSLISGLITAFAAPIVLVLVLIGIFLWVPSWPGGEALVWHYLGAGVNIGSATFSLVHILFILGLFYFIRALVKTAQRVLTRLTLQATTIDKSLIPPFQTAITYGLWIFFSLVSLYSLGFSLEKLAIIAGGLSVGIGFGMQNIVNNFLSGLILIFSRTIHAGDYVEVNGKLGVVKKISIRATMVETADHATIFVPNSEFISTRLINWTSNGRSVRREVAVGVAYGTDASLVTQLLLQVAHDDPQVLKNPPADVLFSNFGPSTIDFTLRYWGDIGAAPKIGSNIRAEIVRVFKENDITIAFPQLDVHMEPQTLLPAPPPKEKMDEQTMAAGQGTTTPQG